MKETMKRIVVMGPSETIVKEFPMPEINDDQILVKILYCGVCMSEHYAWEHAEENNGVDRGFGHEPFGIVEKIGANVTNVKVGDRVAYLGGGFAEYGVAHKDNIFLVPDEVADEDATVEPLACLLSAVSKVPMTFPGESSVAVVGCGYMGCGAISLLKLRGAGKVVAIDVNKGSLEMALKYGADEAYLPEELPEEYLGVGDRLGSGGFDYVMEWGETADSLNLAIKVTKMLGFLGIGAYHTGDLRPIDMQLAGVKAITMLNTHPRDRDRTKKGAVKAFELMASGRWEYQKLPVKIYPLDKLDQAHTEITTKYGKWIKSLVDCQGLGFEPYLKNID